MGLGDPVERSPRRLRRQRRRDLRAQLAEQHALGPQPVEHRFDPRRIRAGVAGRHPREQLGPPDRLRGQLHHVAHERRDAQVEDVAVLVAARHGWSLREGQPPPDDDRRRVQVDAEPPADVGAGLGLTKQAGEPLDVRLGS